MVGRVLEDHADTERCFTLTQLCRMLEVPRGRVRGWIRSGLLHPKKTERRLWSFDFREMTRARALLRLTRAGATRTEINRSLGQIGRWLPEEEDHLGQLEPNEANHSLLVRLEDGRLAEPTGQLCFDFTERETGRSGLLARLSPPTSETADELFEAGLVAETDGLLDEAVTCYERALLVGGPEAEITFSLANVLHALGRKPEAAQRFMQSVEIEPDYTEAWNNLGITFADLEQYDRAVDAFECALRLDPNFSDAHQNLAKTISRRDG